jgi:DNA-directed RNA polymerase subunit H (RpoH/RPB5)
MANILTNKDILTVYNSRKTILEILGDLLFDTKDYMDFTINEVDSMAANNQLDMLISHSKESHDKTVYDDTKIYVKYMLSTKAIRIKAIEELIEELYIVEEVLTPTDTLAIVINDEPNDSLVATLKYLYDKRGIFVVVHNIKRLQRNILKHTLVPPHTIMTSSDIEILKKDYNLKNLQQLPEMSRFDPVALIIGMRPGQVCKIERKSPTSMVSMYYRICV